MLSQKLRRLATSNLIRSPGIGGCLGVALLLAYPLVPPPTLAWNDVLLVTALLGVAAYQLLLVVVVRPLSYYFSLLELYLLRRLIGEQARTEITRELTFRYFLGDRFLKAGEKCGEDAVQH